MENTHQISIACEQPSRSGALRFMGGHRARCSCGWSSDCYSQMSDTQRAIEVHLRRAQSRSFDNVLARSSIGRALADVKARGIDAHLADQERLERAVRARRRRSRPAKKLSPEDAAFMRGFGAALATIWRCQHDGQMVRQLIQQNNFTLASFRGVGMIAADYDAIKKAMGR